MNRAYPKAIRERRGEAMQPHIPFFWLHIKKSAGTSTRKLLQPYYREVDRIKKPPNFIQSHPSEYNDILNNYRVVLGEYQFRRCLFAKQFLYKGQWDNIVSFAFLREPVDRCLSMFSYMFWPNRGKGNLRRLLATFVYKRKVYTASRAFDEFLDRVLEARESDSIYKPLGLVFSTHTAPVWEDVTDLEGKLLLKKIFRLEHLIDGINEVYEECRIEDRIKANEIRLNQSRGRLLLAPSKQQLRRIEGIYAQDFELYEGASRAERKS